jgi:hypothetical protein
MGLSRRARIGLALFVALLAALALGSLVALVVNSNGSTSPSASTLVIPRCLTGQLRVTPGTSEGALGHIGVVVRFTNHSRSTCELYGYPGLQMLDAAGKALPTSVQRGIAYTVPKVPERAVKLPPGGRASFDLGYSDSTGYGNETCPSSTRVEITPPNDFKPLTIAWRIAPYGGDIPHLKCGEITVSPVFAGAGT